MTEPRRELFPESHAILWNPMSDSYHLLASMMRGSAERRHLFVTQRALLQVDRHLGADPDSELCGFLAGHLAECPRTCARFVVIDMAIPLSDVAGDSCSRIDARAADMVRRHLRSHSMVLVGWYRSGGPLGVRLLPDDVETQVAFFPEPWHTTLIVVPNPLAPSGAFFTHDARVARSYAVPFYELFEPHVTPESRLHRTSVGWSTYTPATPVPPLDAPERELIASTVARPLPPPPPEQPATGPLDELIDAIADPFLRLREMTAGAAARAAEARRNETPLIARPKGRLGSMQESSRAASAQPTQLPSPSPAYSPPASPVERLGDGEIPAAPRAQPSVPSLPTAALPATAAPVAAASDSATTTPAPQPVPSTPDTAATSPPPRPAPFTPPAFTEPPAAAEPLRPIPLALRGTPPTPRPVVWDLDVDEDDEPPYDVGESEKWNHRKRIAYIVSAGAFLSVLVIGALRPSNRPIMAAASEQSATSEAGNGPVNGSVNGAVNGAELGPGAADARAHVNLVLAADSLSEAMSTYRAISGDFEGHLVGCRVLALAYRDVDKHWDHVARARRGIGTSLPTADSARVAMLGAELADIRRTFQRTECRRA